MQKKKRTKKDKVRSSQRQRAETGFVVPEKLLVGKKEIEKKKVGENYFRKDLLRTVITTIVAISIEVGLWFYLKRFF